MYYILIYIFYCISTYFIEYFMQDNFKYSRIKKIHQVLEKITRINQKDQKFIVSCYHMNCYLQKIHYTSSYIFYILGVFISKQFQISKNDVNPTSTSGDTCKTIFIILFKLFSIGDSFKFKATQETRLI